MRGGLALLGIFALALICLLLWPRTAKNQKSATPLPAEPSASATPTEPAEAQTAGTAGRLTVPVSPAGIPPTTPRLLPYTNSGQLPEAVQRVLDEWRTPIEFYGRAVDENTNPVARAYVNFDCNDLSPSGTSYYHTETDTNGLFSITGIKGKLLAVKVHKEGYYSCLPFGANFFYSGENENFVPHADVPVVFHLRKKSEGVPLVSLKQNYRVPRDGTPLEIDLTTGKATIRGGGDLVVQCWTEDEGQPSGAKYDWHCRVTPSGGFVATEEQFPFTAPDQGYAPAAEVQMPADRPDWKSDVALKFYYRLADGRYGRMTFSMIAGGQHFCMVDSFLNPSGSRNLEPMEAKPPAPVLPPGMRAVIPEFK